MVLTLIMTMIRCETAFDPISSDAVWFEKIDDFCCISLTVGNRDDCPPDLRAER